MTSNLEYKKKCSSCKEFLPLNAFNRNKNRIGGRGSRCKKCIKKWQQNNREKVNRNAREWRKKNPEKYKKTVYKWIDKNRKKFNAQAVFNDHKRRGNISLKSACELCGSAENLEAHHFDYGKPLEVTTFCKRCHLGFHACLRKGLTVLEALQKVKVRRMREQNLNVET